MTALAEPTFVLLHGAGLGSWCRQGVTPLLQHPALVVDLPGRGATPHDLHTATRSTYVEAVVAAIRGANLARYILVAHSFSGSIAHLIAAALPQQIVQIIFLGTAVPPPGGSVIDTLTLLGRIQLGNDPQQVLLRQQAWWPAGALQAARAWRDAQLIEVGHLIGMEQQYPELIAAQPGHIVGAAEGLPERLGDDVVAAHHREQRVRWPPQRLGGACLSRRIGIWWSFN